MTIGGQPDDANSTNRPGTPQARPGGMAPYRLTPCNRERPMQPGRGRRSPERTMIDRRHCPPSPSPKGKNGIRVITLATLLATLLCVTATAQAADDLERAFVEKLGSL